MITVIGGSGFIGSSFCRILSEANISFEIVDLKKSLLFPEKTKIADIRNKTSLSSAISGDTIVHLAAVHRDDVRDKSEYYSTNVEGTRNICRVAELLNIDKIVFTSSVAVYGFAAPNTDESGVINPFNDYGKSKFQGEEVLRVWYQTNPESRALSIIRPTVAFGEGNRGNVYNLMKHIWSGKFLMIGSGNNRKSMAYVGNVAAFIRHMCRSDQGYGLFNYVDTPDYDMNGLIDLLRRNILGKAGVGPRLPTLVGLAVGACADLATRLFNLKLPISVIRVRKFTATTSFSSAVDQVEGFRAPYSLADGIERTVNADFLNPDPDMPEFFTE